MILTNRLQSKLPNSPVKVSLNKRVGQCSRIVIRAVGLGAHRHFVISRWKETEPPAGLVATVKPLRFGGVGVQILPPINCHIKM